MLIELNIRNIALIESLRIEFSDGFNVLTGETGAGKSIVVDSINLVLGGRADRDMIRTGADKGFVQALFDVSNNAFAVETLESVGVTPEEGLVTVTRELSRSGRNVCRICGVIVQLGVLKSVTALLMDVHGQHEHQFLMDPAKHLEFLDSFGDALHRQKLEEVHEAYRKRSEVRTKLKALMKDASEKERLVDILKFQVNEISSAKLKPGEEAQLESQLKVLENSEKIRVGVGSAYQLIYSGSGKGLSAQDALLQAHAAVQKIASIDEKYQKIAESLKEIYYSVQEVGMDLQAMNEELAFDPDLINRVESRLDLISKLERKYGATEADVIAFGAKAKARLDSIESGDEQIIQLKKEYKVLDTALRETCNVLTDSRSEIARKLENDLLEQLKDLGMGKTRFRVQISTLEKPTIFGQDSVEFMISPNPGEPLKPLSSTASGGELSRIMLGLKTISLNNGSVDSMVFDEIDTGVSGRMAQIVGEKMLTIGIHSQVLCVTHLPQIAALGDRHFKVMKHTENDRTITEVHALDRDGRIHELSRLVGGADDSQSSLSHAAHMLGEAAETKTRIVNALKGNESIG